MNKTRNNSRKCAFCPHHSQQTNCCCKKTNSVKNYKKSSTKPHSLINESSIHFMNDNQQQLHQMYLPTIISENSKLKHENKNLKYDLLSISHFINEERVPVSSKQFSYMPTLTTLKTESDHNLADRLYSSNKNLQQAILKIDSLSRQNKQLNQKDCLLMSELEGENIKNEMLKQEIAELNGHLKKANQRNLEIVERNTLKEDYRILRQKYQNLKFQNSNLIEEVQRFRAVLLSKGKPKPQNMSPEWIAETSNKLSLIEHKIDFAQNKLKHSDFNKHKVSETNANESIVCQNINADSEYYQIIHKIKEDLALSINTIHSKTRKFTSVFDGVGSVQNVNVNHLICSLLEGFVQSCISQYVMIQRELKRKIHFLEKRMDNLLGKMQNFILQFKNRELRKRSTSRSKSRIIVMGSKLGSQSKSPLLRRGDKQNINALNYQEKSY